MEKSLVALPTNLGSNPAVGNQFCSFPCSIREVHGSRCTHLKWREHLQSVHARLTGVHRGGSQGSNMKYPSNIERKQPMNHLISSSSLQPNGL